MTKTRVVVVRADNSNESSVLTDYPSELADRLVCALNEVGAGYLRRARRFAHSRLRHVARESELRDALNDRAVAVAALVPEASVVREIGSWGLGEVLGFFRSPEPAPCLLTGEPTHVMAYISPRR